MLLAAILLLCFWAFVITPFLIIGVGFSSVSDVVKSRDIVIIAFKVLFVTLPFVSAILFYLVRKRELR